MRHKIFWYKPVILMLMQVLAGCAIETRGKVSYDFLMTFLLQYDLSESETYHIPFCLLEDSVVRLIS